MRDRCLHGPCLAFSPEAKGEHKYMHGYSLTRHYSSLPECTAVGTKTRLITGHYSCLPAKFTASPWKPRWARMHGFSHLVIHATRTSFLQLMYVHASALSQRWAQFLGYRHFIVSVQYVHWIVLCLSQDEISIDCGKTLFLIDE